MAWYHQATSHYLSQCWHSSVSPSDVNRAQSVNSSPFSATVNWVNIGSDNGLSPTQCQAIILTNAELLSFGPLQAKYNEVYIKIQNFSFMKMHLKIPVVKWRAFCPGGRWVNCFCFRFLCLFSWNELLPAKLKVFCKFFTIRNMILKSLLILTTHDAEYITFSLAFLLTWSNWRF